MPSAVNLVPGGLTSTQEAYVPGAFRADGQASFGANVAFKFTGTPTASTKDPFTDTEAGWINVSVSGTTYGIPYYALT